MSTLISKRLKELKLILKNKDEIKFFAQEKLFFDINEFPDEILLGKNIALCGKEIHIMKDKSHIDVSGAEVSDSSSSSNSSDNNDSDRNNNDGKNGRNGKNGKSGGHVLIICDTIFKSERLRITANGSDATNGEDGDDGDDGDNGDDGEDGSIDLDIYPLSCKWVGSKASKDIDTLMNNVSRNADDSVKYDKKNLYE